MPFILRDKSETNDPGSQMQNSRMVGGAKESKREPKSTTRLFLLNWLSGSRGTTKVGY